MMYLLVWLGNKWLVSEEIEAGEVKRRADTYIDEGTPILIVEDLEDLEDLGIEI
jgi:hypothetical protein